MRRVLIAATARTTSDLDELLQAAASRGVPRERVEPAALDALCDGGHHQGVAIEVSAFPYAPDSGQFIPEAAPAAGELVLLLDHVQDPQNVGAVLRTAESAGARAVLIPADRACGVTPAVVRASAGASEHIQVAIVTNLVREARRLKQKGYWVVGLEGTPDATLYTLADLARPVALVLGGEGCGLGRLVRETCDFLIRLPMMGQVRSLNVSAATAVALYEIRRQQGLNRAAAAEGSA